MATNNKTLKKKQPKAKKVRKGLVATIVEQAKGKDSEEEIFVTMSPESKVSANAFFAQSTRIRKLTNRSPKLWDVKEGRIERVKLVKR